jgi:hypothetical protein
MREADASVALPPTCAAMAAISAAMIAFSLTLKGNLRAVFSLKGNLMELLIYESDIKRNN